MSEKVRGGSGWKTVRLILSSSYLVHFAYSWISAVQVNDTNEKAIHFILQFLFDSFRICTYNEDG